MNDSKLVHSPSESPPRPVGVVVSCAWLTGIVVAAFPLFAWYGFTAHGTHGMLAALVAAAVCWVGATIALILVGITRDPQQAVNGVLIGMLFRMGLPLMVGLALHRQNENLAAAGVLGMILCYYFVTLLFETLLSLRMIAPARKVGGVT